MIELKKSKKNKPNTTKITLLVLLLELKISLRGVFFKNEICQSNKQYVFCLKCSKIIKQFPVILKYQVLLFHQQFRALEHCAIMVNTNKSSVSVMPSSKQYKNPLIIFQFGDIIKVTKFTTKYTKYFKTF